MGTLFVASSSGRQNVWRALLAMVVVVLYVLFAVGVVESEKLSEGRSNLSGLASFAFAALWWLSL